MLCSESRYLEGRDQSWGRVHSRGRGSQWLGDSGACAEAGSGASGWDAGGSLAEAGQQRSFARFGTLATMNRCAEAAAVAATVPGSGVGDAGLRPPMVPRQASFFPPPVPNPFVQQTRISAARRLQVEAQCARRRRGCGRMEEAGEESCIQERRHLWASGPRGHRV